MFGGSSRTPAEGCPNWKELGVIFSSRKQDWRCLSCPAHKYNLHIPALRPQPDLDTHSMLNRLKSSFVSFTLLSCFLSLKNPRPSLSVRFAVAYKHQICIWFWKSIHNIIDSQFQQWVEYEMNVLFPIKIFHYWGKPSRELQHQRTWWWFICSSTLCGPVNKAKCIELLLLATRRQSNRELINTNSWEPGLTVVSLTLNLFSLSSVKRGPVLSLFTIRKHETFSRHQAGKVQI